MTVGDSQVDVKSSIGWSYSSNPDGYLFVDFVYPTGTVVRARLDDRNDFYRFLLQIELFIDNQQNFGQIRFLSTLFKSYP